MFKKMQLKLTTYYSVILIVALLSMSALLYFSVYEFSKQNLLADFSRDVNSIIESDWIDAKKVIYEESHLDEDNKATTKDEEDDQSEIHQSNLGTAASSIKIEKIPSILRSFSNYVVFDVNGNRLFQNDQSYNFTQFYSHLKINLGTITPPKFINGINDNKTTYIFYNSPIVIEDQVRGSFVIFNDVSQTFITLKELLNVLLIFGITGSILSVVFGYFTAGRIIKPVKLAYQEKQTFLENVSHELRTPLSAIVLNTELIEGSDASDAQQMQESVSAIKNEVLYMREQITGLLSKERKNELFKPYSQVEINLSKILSTEIGRFQIIANQSSNTIYSYVQPDIFIEGQEKELVNVFRTLLDNAIKYSSEGTQVNIKLIQKSRLDNIVFFEITNHGSLINPEDLSRIFERNYRVNNEVNNHQNGYGIGLSICKDILNKMKAQIEVTSSLENGTTFTISFYKKYMA